MAITRNYKLVVDNLVKSNLVNDQQLQEALEFLAKNNMKAHGIVLNAINQNNHQEDHVSPSF